MNTWNRQTLRGARVLVVGLGRFGGGVGVTRWLVSEGAQVTVTDQAGESSLVESVRAVADLPVRLVLGGHEGVCLDETDLAILNPAVVKSKSDLFARMRARGIPFTTEMNLFCERCPAPVIGVTGSFGKSTTCAMLARVLEQGCGRSGFHDRQVFLGGNIGGSLLGRLGEITADDIVVLEMSSAQLEDVPRIGWTPWIAVVTNLVPHHLDRYGSVHAYFAAKLNIISEASDSQQAILGPICHEAEQLLQVRIADRRHRVNRVDERFFGAHLSVPGAHNRRNAACVLTVARELGVNESAAREALCQFAGLPHRLEHVRTRNGVRFVNDSKSTSPGAAIAALSSFDGPIIAIVGGKFAEEGLGLLAATLAARCRAVVCFGQVGPVLAQAVRANATAAAPVVRLVDDVDQAVRQAAGLARSGDLVLFSPGAPSFDAYANFERRGRDFIRAVTSLS